MTLLPGGTGSRVTLTINNFAAPPNNTPYPVVWTLSSANVLSVNVEAGYTVGVLTFETCNLLSGNLISLGHPGTATFIRE